MTDAYRDNPMRPPHWRWQRAVEIDGGGFRATRALDGPEGFYWIRRALRIKRRYAAAGNQSVALYSLMLRDRPMYWAYRIWLEDKKPTRWGIEARLTAGESIEQIANKLGTDPEIVAAYANVFFDVREKLDKMDYVVNVIMADSVSRGLQERHYDLLWKMIGFTGGEHALDAVISKSLPVQKPANADQVAGFFQDFAVNTMKYKAALSALTVPVNTHTQLSLIDSFVKYVEVERTTENAMKAQTSIVDNIGAMLGALQFTVGTKLDAAAVKVLPFDEGAAELRSTELLTLASGGTIENQTDLQKLNFPEKT